MARDTAIDDDDAYAELGRMILQSPANMILVGRLLQLREAQGDEALDAVLAAWGEFVDEAQVAQRRASLLVVAADK